MSTLHLENPERFTRATGYNVILKPREDLFSETDRDVGLTMVSLATDITAVPDNMACVEVVSAGELVDNVKAGDLVFVDFYEVKQGYILSNDELYICGADALKGVYNTVTQEIEPGPNYVVTRARRDRFELALTGTDRVAIPRSVTSVAGGRTSGGEVSTEVLYEEVVRVGPLTRRPFPGVMTPLERRCLNIVCRDLNVYGADAWAQYDGVDEEEAKAFNDLRQERLESHEPDISPGELVVFCREVAQKLRCKGEFWYLVPYANVLAVIDDEALIDDAVRRGVAGRIAV